MTKIKNLFIVHGPQFGYHTDIYKWCEYLNDIYHIDLLCFDQGKPKYYMSNVNIHYVSYETPRLVRWLVFMLKALFNISCFNGLIIVCHFKLSRYLKVFLPWKKMVLDIRTFSINSNESIRKSENAALFKSVKKFNFVTVISEGLREMLPKDKSCTAVIPLGAEKQNTANKNYDELHLLYVGTFYNRHLEDTIKGFALAKKQLPEVKMVYHIVGGGMKGEDNCLRELSKTLDVSDSIIFYGMVPHDKLGEYFEKCNVGVSYVPIVPYYEFQPVTKTFEYTLAGLYTIATATKSNKEVITESNGILIDDNEESFADAIIKISNIRNSFNSDEIKESLSSYSWENIVKTTMVGVLKDIEARFNL